MHRPGDTDGKRFALKEALTGEAAVAAQSVTKDSRVLTVEQMLAELDKIFMPKTESALAQREYKQHPEEPVLMYFAAKKALWDKAYTDQADIQTLLDSTRHGLTSRYVRRKLIGEAHQFTAFEQLRDSALTYVSAQRATISEGLAMDTCMDGLNATNPYTRAQQSMVAQVAGTHAVQPAEVFTHWPPPEPARVQSQWGAQAPAKAQNQWGPGRTYAVQTMPAAPFLCHTCGQSGHFKRECPNGGASIGRGGARPAGPGRGRGGYQSRGSYKY